VSTISGDYVFLALSLSLSLAAGISLLLFLRRDPASLTVQARPGVIRLMKGESASVELVVTSGMSGWLVLSSALAPTNSGVSLETVYDKRGEFMVAGDHAGRYSRLGLTAKFVDALDLFERTGTIRPEHFVVEVLPRSLLEPPSRPNLLTVTFGEVPAGVRGGGQEFYGVEAYAGSQEPRDILWRRVARSPDQTISAKVREANFPGLVTVALIEVRPADRSIWMDAATEAMGKIGVALLELGIVLEVVVPASKEPSPRAATYDELADLLMDMWKEDAARESSSVFLIPSMPAITGSSTLADQTLSDLTNRSSTFIVPDGSSWDGTAQGGLDQKVRNIDDFISRVILS
jgi:uncharacterized protein (DUF58 family)